MKQDNTAKIQLQTQNLTSGLKQTKLLHQIFESTGY